MGLGWLSAMKASVQEWRGPRVHSGLCPTPQDTGLLPRAHLSSPGPHSRGGLWRPLLASLCAVVLGKRGTLVPAQKGGILTCISPKRLVGQPWMRVSGELSPLVCLMGGGNRRGLGCRPCASWGWGTERAVSPSGDEPGPALRPQKPHLSAGTGHVGPSLSSRPESGGAGAVPQSRGGAGLPRSLA